MIRPSYIKRSTKQDCQGKPYFIRSSSTSNIHDATVIRCPAKLQWIIEKYLHKLFQKGSMNPGYLNELKEQLIKVTYEHQRKLFFSKDWDIEREMDVLRIDKDCRNESRSVIMEWIADDDNIDEELSGFKRAHSFHNKEEIGRRYRGIIIKMENDINKPYKICDVNREKKKGIVASSLEDLISKVPDKLGLPSENLTVALECDGTEVDDEEYFSTLEPDTILMILHGNEKWAPNMPKCQVSLDQTDEVSLDDKGRVANLVGRLQYNPCHISLLGGQDLELLSDMDPDSLADIVTDRDNRIILEHIKEASGRILLEKRQAHDAMELLKLYHQSVANGSEDVSTPSQERV